MYHSTTLSDKSEKTLRAVQEKWISIVSFKDFTFDGKYEVSNLGNVRNSTTKKSLSTYSNQRGQGYLKTKIIDVTKKRRSMYIHQLVAYYFIGKNNSRFIDVDHIDGNARNNSAANLQYLSHRDNCIKRNPIHKEQ